MDTIDRNSALRLAALHLLPGAAVALVYAIAAPLAVGAGLPRVAAVLAGFVIAGIPLQVAVMLAARRRGERVVVFREPRHIAEYAGATILLFAIVFGMLMLPTRGASLFLRDHVFFWLPPLFLPEAKGAAAVAGPLVVATLVAKLLIDGIVNPIVEETYFRGFLLPRLGRFGIAAPVINTLLFTLGHFWQVTNYPTIFLLVLPMTAYTWWRRNFYPQAAVHVALNVLGTASALAAVWR